MLMREHVSPNGQLVAVDISDGQVEIREHPHGKFITKLFSTCNFYDPGWSPDSKHFCYNQTNGRLALWNVDGNEYVQSEFFNKEGISSVSTVLKEYRWIGFGWSPDSSRLAVSADTTGRIFLISWQEIGKPKPKFESIIIDEGYFMCDPKWSPCGKYLACVVWFLSSWHSEKYVLVAETSKPCRRVIYGEDMGHHSTCVEWEASGPPLLRVNIGCILAMPIGPWSDRRHWQWKGAYTRAAIFRTYHALPDRVGPQLALGVSAAIAKNSLRKLFYRYE